MSTTLSTPKFPAAIEVKLKSVRWRHAWLTAARALCVSASLLVAMMLGSMAVDWLFPFASPVLRLCLTGASLLATTCTLLTLSVKPIQSALGWNRAAAAVDEEIPQLQERW